MDRPAMEVTFCSAFISDWLAIFVPFIGDKSPFGVQNVVLMAVPIANPRLPAGLTTHNLSLFFVNEPDQTA